VELVLDTKKMYRVKTHFSRQKGEAANADDAKGVWSRVLTRGDVTVTVDTFRGGTL
jgi:hypothetical protein